MVQYELFSIINLIFRAKQTHTHTDNLIDLGASIMEQHRANIHTHAVMNRDIGDEYRNEVTEI
jgi:hypothetical protein